MGLVLCGIASLLQAGTAASHAGHPAGFRGGVGPDAESCRPTLVGVAHQDDDLLFVNPETERLIRRRCSAGTVYLTAGDAGRSFVNDPYVRRREEGLRAAYARMAGVPNRWLRDDLTVRGRRIVSHVLNGRPDVRLVFVRLPDGFPKGTGSSQYLGQSLLKLFRGHIGAISPVDGSVSYGREELISAISDVISLQKAERVLTLDYDSSTFGSGPPHPADHSDHEISARIFRKAAFMNRARPDVASYVGYGVSPLAANLTRTQRAEKVAVYRAYAEHAECLATPCPSGITLGRDSRRWIEREHRRMHRRPRPGEIMSAIGRTDTTVAVERCLTADMRGPTGGAVTTADCDGGPAQRWTFTSGTVRSASSGGCLTVSRTVGTSPCNGSRAQVWWRDADGRIGSGDRCLFQDDLAMPNPRLGLRGCTPYQPELRWQWWEYDASP
ncbi:PIG-L family deacetylase [Streptomyces katrae]|uniref:PIG-L family deacetylase n=1 Tax=Streptomyces katrae TaxID=68223 RepID=A0ABT7GT89_9ACTN|nr:ricin-type beta-trefoil lectin domain protein [Streptomyces katrae]MDK9496792.1 PIG-L family deacetylase [Streptomyces katrae]